MILRKFDPQENFPEIRREKLKIFLNVYFIEDIIRISIIKKDTGPDSSVGMLVYINGLTTWQSGVRTLTISTKCGECLANTYMCQKIIFF